MNINASLGAVWFIPIISKLYYINLSKMERKHELILDVAAISTSGSLCTYFTEFYV